MSLFLHRRCFVSKQISIVFAHYHFFISKGTIILQTLKISRVYLNLRSLHIDYVIASEDDRLCSCGTCPIVVNDERTNGPAAFPKY